MKKKKEENLPVVSGEYEVEVNGTVGETAAAVPANTPFNNSFNMEELLKTAGMLEVSEKEKKILRAPVPEDKITIREDGLIFLSWFEYQRRLDEAFGASWSLVPNGMPKLIDNQVIWGFYLVVRGKLVDFAIGGQEYVPSNKTMTYSDAMEGAKSNALMRLCKRLGIGLELWDRRFVEKWKAKYATAYFDKKRGRYIWKLKDGIDTIPAPAPAPTPEKPVEVKKVEDTFEAEAKPIEAKEGATIIAHGEVDESRKYRVFEGDFTLRTGTGRNGKEYAFLDCDSEKPLRIWLYNLPTEPLEKAGNGKIFYYWKKKNDKWFAIALKYEVVIEGEEKKPFDEMVEEGEDYNEDIEL